MSLFAILYTLLIGPIQLMFEVIFWAASLVFANAGQSIIVLSLAMNILVLPLYIRADAMQEESRQREKALRPYVDHIKKTFTGDERYMILQTFYRQRRYKPTDALKGAMSLLLEIPFFMAAYNFLSGLYLLEGTSFGPIADLSQPDGLLIIGSVTLNLLPILMTVINLISSSVYTTDMSFKEKFQLYGMAAIFLVLLYNSPSGLVFYWTLNNLFSLVKNLCYKVKNKKILLKAGCIGSSVVGIGLLVYILFIHRMINEIRQFYVIVVCILLQAPLLLLFRKKKEKKTYKVTENEHRMFLLSGLILALLAGLLIPSAVMKASPEEFINTVKMINPLIYVLSAALLGVGTFLIWSNVLYSLANAQWKKWMCCGYWLLAGTALANYMIFGKEKSSLSPNLKVRGFMSYSVQQILVNLLVLLAVAGVLFLIWKKEKKLQKTVSVLVCLTLVGMSAVNVYAIQRVLSERIEPEMGLEEHELISIPLSKKGKNVVVLMLDRAINGYVPYMMKEKPELKKQFAGFTYYPNTISYGTNTNFGSPGLYGGYEYTPLEMNRRDTELLVDKHNEALRVMPVLFTENGYTVTVSDPSYAGYSEIPDLSIYSDHPNIRAFLTEGWYHEDLEADSAKTEHVRRRNFFCYSISKMVPRVLYELVYYYGNYCDVNRERSQICSNQYRSNGVSDEYRENYEIMNDLPLLTEIRDSEENTFLMFASTLPHTPTMLQTPEYTISANVDNEDYIRTHEKDFYEIDGRKLRMDNSEQATHYQVNMATFLTLGRWFDFLRENGVYDNTRIILVSDHGYRLNQLDDLILNSAQNGEDIMQYNALLMMKDFGSTEFSEDRQFMTNADVPTMAFGELIDEPINPATGKRIDSRAKYDGEQYVFWSRHWNVRENNGTRFMAEGTWHSVHTDVLDRNNWKEVADSSM